MKTKNPFKIKKKKKIKEKFQKKSKKDIDLIFKISNNTPKSMIESLRKIGKELKIEVLQLRIVGSGGFMNQTILGLWLKTGFKRKKFKNINGLTMGMN